ncbi:2276_t:CDS:2 [Acaulospora morrowiae]|uniref:Histone H1 n=1 Tax=Acaulospora morrowiae TaxID=94023 RepID=A0A9N9F135_9GLOM|nr:2276_t:CDS:2 [Acaulospora morrowiae]
MMDYDEEVIIKLHDTYTNTNNAMNEVAQNKVTSLSDNAADINMIVTQQNNVLSDTYNKVSFSEWVGFMQDFGASHGFINAYNVNFGIQGEEDGDFEIDEDFVRVVQPQTLQDDALKHHQEFMDEDCDTRTEVEETITSEQVQPVEGKNDENKREIPYDNSTKEIENMDQSSSAQVSEVSVQPVLIVQKDISIPVTKYKQSEKGKKKGTRKTPVRKKTKADTEPSQFTNDQKHSADEYSDIDSSKDTTEDADLTPSITKSGRKVQKPIFYNPAKSERKVKPSEVSNEQQKILVESKKTPVKRTAERRQHKTARSTQNKAYDALMRVDHAMTPTPIVPKSVQQSPLENIQVFNQYIDSRDQPNLAFFSEELESDDSMVCNICQEGLSEKGNWIILCDNCDTPYHQICHKPVISDEFADSEKEWKCLNCVDCPSANKRARIDKRNLTGKSRGRPKNEKSSIILGSDSTEISKEHLGESMTSANRVGSASKLLTYKQIEILLTREQKIEYFSSLPKEVLVNLLLLAEQIAPNIPLYPANILQKYRDVNASKYGKSKSNLQAKTEVAVEESNVHMDTSESSAQHEVGEDSIIPKRETPEVMTPEPTVSSLPSANVPKKYFAFYVDIFIKAITVMNQPNGSSAHSIYSWIKSNYVVPEKFQNHAKKHLFDAVAQGIIVKNTKMTYKINTSYPYVPSKDTGENPFKPLNSANCEASTQNNQITKANLDVILDQSNTTILNNIDGVKGQGRQMNSENQERNPHGGQLILALREGNSSHDIQSTLTNCERSQSCQLTPNCRQRSLNQSGQPPNQPILEQKPIDVIDQVYQRESSQQMLSTSKPEHRDSLINNNTVNTSTIQNQNQNINFTRQEQILKNPRNPVPISSIMHGNIAPRPSRIRPPNSFMTNQYLTVPRQNINQGLNNFSLSNQSLSMLNSGIGSQTILPPINPQQQQQQQHWPTSFNPFYMIPNTNDSQFGLMHSTYPTYGQSQQAASYRGHNGMQNNGSLMNGNHNGQNINGSVNSSLQEMG